MQTNPASVSYWQAVAWFMLWGLLAALVGCSGPLADPAFEPTPARDPRVPAPAEFVPPARPSVERGKPLFEEYCVACHGDHQVGYGIGVLFMNPKPTRFIYPENVRRDSPQTYYRAITKGVLGTAMLAWDLKLNEQQRWDAAFYARSLATMPDEIRAGKELYADQCAVCHNDTGDGNGPQASSQTKRPTVLADPRYLAAQTGQRLWYATAGLPALPDHDWTAKLNEEQRWEIIDYIWTFMYDPGFIVRTWHP